MIVRCSEIGDIMTNDRSGKDIGKTAYSKVEEIALRNVGYNDLPLLTEPITKGIELEEEGISKVQQLYPNEVLVKNKDRKTIEIVDGVFLTGECDILTIHTVDDIKIPFDFYNWHNAELTKGYEWQLLGYMLLFDRREANIQYVWLHTPQYLIEESVKKYWFAYGGDERYEKVLQQAIKNHTINVNNPIKTYHVPYIDDKINQLKERLIKLKPHYDKYSESLANA